MQVPFVDLSWQYNQIRDELLKRVDAIGRSGIFILGPNVEEFEAKMANFLGVRRVVGVGNGSDALWLPLKALGIGPGDEVITAGNSFIASAWAIAAAGATPVLADVGCDMNISADSVRDLITTNTRAVVPVHLTGNPAAMDELISLADEHELLVVEDAAQAIGARYKGRMVGSLGVAASFSMHPLKNLGVLGDGGFLATDSDLLADDVRLLRNHGLSDRDTAMIWGYNSRLDEIQAAVALEKLSYLDEWNGMVREIAERYTEALSHLVQVPVVANSNESVFHNYIVRTDDRDALRSHLTACGVDTRIHYPVPITDQPCYLKDTRTVKNVLPNVLHDNERILSLPIYPGLPESSLSYVISAVYSFFEAKSTSSF